MAKLLLIHSNAADGNTTIEDSSPSARAITVAGNTHHETDQAYFWWSSLQFDGTGDYLSVGSVTDFDFGTNDFTIDFWIYVTSIPAYDTVIGRLVSWFNSGQLWIRMNPANSGMEVAVGGTTFDINSLGLNAWHHIAVTRDSGYVRVFVDGTIVDQGSATASISAGSGDPMYIGRNPVNSAEEFVGYLDEIRIDDTAIWTANFTVPSNPYDSPTNGPLKDIAILADMGYDAYVSLPSPLGGPAILGQTAYDDLLAGTVYKYVMDLTGPGGTVRVPISSWQATLQTGRQNYGQCVVPAAGEWEAEINAATSFSVSRIGTLKSGGALEQVLVDVAITSIQLASGSLSYSATITGYSDPYPTVPTPPTELDRVLQNIRSVNTQTGGRRVRSDIDWLLFPGLTAYVQGAPMTVDYINYYVNSNGEYMDCGERL